MRIAARAAIGVIVVAAVTFGLWQVRDVVILLVLSLSIAAAVRPGVDLLKRYRVPEVLAIGAFVLAGVGSVVLFFWFAVPPAIHQLSDALSQPTVGGTGLRHNVLAWLQHEVHKLPSGASAIHPIATYGKQATKIVAAVFFLLAATWYWIADAERMLDAVVARASSGNRERVRRTVLAIEARLGNSMRLTFLMLIFVAVLLSIGFYAVGLHYWLLVAGSVAVLGIIPVVGPVLGVALVGVVGFSQSTHVMVLALIVVVGFRQLQDYVINPHVMGKSVGFSPLVTLTTVSVVGLLFGAFAVILAIPFTSAVATLIDVFVLGHEPPPEVEGAPRHAAAAAT
ncbi:MAG TPA: AI-2E family transporter [Gaiellaceae bacterium]|nr:AI-2E family transporter [Gaiellaceae bacterium]